MTNYDVLLCMSYRMKISILIWKYGLITYELILITMLFAWDLVGFSFFFLTCFSLFLFTDLGPISLNWFEELSSEAPPYEPKLLELDAPIDQTSFKTPKAKPFTYSQLTSTPPIFKEQNTIMPPFSSPGRELDQKKIGTSEYIFAKQCV